MDQIQYFSFSQYFSCFIPPQEEQGQIQHPVHSKQIFSHQHPLTLCDPVNHSDDVCEINLNSKNHADYCRDCAVCLLI